MPTSSVPLVDFFGQEWDRFNDGLRQLGDLDGEQYYQEWKRFKQNPNGTKTVNIPGWDDVIHLGARYTPTEAERAEWYAARRARREPNLNPIARAELERRDTVKRRIASSAQPGYAQAMGSVLTAIDNVQDFLSTVATTMRLGLWGLPRIMQGIAPGATEGTARALATVAARRAAADAAAGFAEAVARRAAAGELAARLALADEALYAAARRGAIASAAESAFLRVFRNASLGLVGRLAGRFVPVVGWVLLASDLLNLLSFLGMMATPAYALACRAPLETLAAGIPAAVFKNALKKEAWSMGALNPFSRQARATRLVRAAGRLPTISNLVEVAQTTDQLFGVGISLGGMVGALNEILFGGVAQAQGQKVQILLPGQRPAVEGAAKEKFSLLPPANQRVLQQAGDIALTAGAVWRVQEVFDETDHLLTAVAYHQAIAVLYDFWHDLPYQDDVAALADRELAAPLNVDATTVAWAELEGITLENHRRWWWAGSPRVATLGEYVEQHRAAVPAALHEFLAPRRGAAAGALYGGLVNAITDNLFALLEPDSDVLKWSFTDDWYLVQHLTESGFFLAPEAREGAVWAWWQESRARLSAQGRRAIDDDWWRSSALRHGVPLVRSLAPDQAVPAVWASRPLEEGFHL